MTEQELRDLIKKVDDRLALADPDAMGSAAAAALETYDYIVAIQEARKLLETANH